MTFHDLEKIVSEHIDLIEISATALASGKDRAAKFLVMEAILVNHLKTLEEGKAQLATLTNASYAQAMLMADGKNVTENKAKAENDPHYAQVREASEMIDAEINWVKNHMKIFDNAHVMFRQYTRDG